MTFRDPPLWRALVSHFWEISNGHFLNKNGKYEETEFAVSPFTQGFCVECDNSWSKIWRFQNFITSWYESINWPCMRTYFENLIIKRGPLSNLEPNPARHRTGQPTAPGLHKALVSIAVLVFRCFPSAIAGKAAPENFWALHKNALKNPPT